MLFSMSSLFLIICIFVVLKTILRHIKNSEFYKKAAFIPGPRTVPILGNAHLFIKNKKNFLHTFNELYDSYPSPFRIWVGNTLIITIFDPEQLKTVLLSTKVLEKPIFYKFFQPWIGNGIFTAPVSTWRIHRKMIAPAFKTKTLQTIAKIFQEHSITLTKALAAKENSKEFDVIEFLSTYSLNTVLEGIMGDSRSLQVEEIEKYSQSVERLLEVISYRIKNFRLHSDFIFNFTQMSKVMKENVAILRDSTYDVIQRKRKVLKSMDNKEDSDGNSNDWKSLLDMLMEQTDNRKALTDKELLDEINTMFSAATDTTVLTAAFTMLVLASLSEIQEKVYQELYQIFGDANPEEYPTMAEDLHRMDYLERVIKETLRIFPVVPFISRRVGNDLNIGNYTLPKGSILLISILQLHRNKKLWHNPLKFDPDRFLPEEAAKRHSYSYIPFSAGPRNCIGFKFGIMSIKMLLSTILRKYILIMDDVTPIEKIKLKHEIFLKPVKAIKIRIEARNPK